MRKIDGGIQNELRHAHETQVNDCYYGTACVALESVRSSQDTDRVPLGADSEWLARNERFRVKSSLLRRYRYRHGGPAVFIWGEGEFSRAGRAAALNHPHHGPRST